MEDCQRRTIFLLPMILCNEDLCLVTKDIYINFYIYIYIYI